RLPPAVVLKELETWLPGHLSKTADTEFPRLVKLLELLPELQECLDDAARVKIRHFVENLPGSETASLFPSITAVELIHDSVSVLLEKITKDPAAIARMKEICEVYRARSKDIPGEILEYIVSSYESALSFDQANTLGEDLIIPNAKAFSKDFTRRIISAVENGQVNGSFQVSSVLSVLKLAEILSPEEFDECLLSTSKATTYRTHLHNPPVRVTQEEPSTAPLGVE
ncbi:MAG: hypothetical protein L3J39_15895, partial [Verrucomicrobiales bacterium]|nr:hypothetical protein [Verrucomicrobiales bacterium]